MTDRELARIANSHRRPKARPRTRLDVLRGLAREALSGVLTAMAVLAVFLVFALCAEVPR